MEDYSNSMEDYSDALTFDHPDDLDAGADWTMNSDNVWIRVENVSIQIRKATDLEGRRFLIIETFPYLDEASSDPIESICQRLGKGRR